MFAVCEKIFFENKLPEVYVTDGILLFWGREE